MRERILIADDQLLADACKTILEPEFQVVGTVADGRYVEDAIAEAIDPHAWAGRWLVGGQHA